MNIMNTTQKYSLHDYGNPHVYSHACYTYTAGESKNALLFGQMSLRPYSFMCTSCVADNSGKSIIYQFHIQYKSNITLSSV